MTLRWIERGLFGVGVALAAWCAIVLAEARYTQTLPIEKIVVTQTPLPDEKPRPLPPQVGTVIARLEAPSVKLTTTVLEGTDDHTLSLGSGHIEDTPLPGEGGNIGIAGHRDTVFRALRRIHDGDPLDLTTADRVYHYRIEKMFIVNPEDVYVLDPTDRPTLTLVTCYPFEFIGHAPRRFIVQARLVGDEPHH
jgi:sortase A